MTKGTDFVKKGKRGYNHCSTMSNNAWCDINSKGDISKLLDRCHSCNSQKITTFTPRQFQLEGFEFKNTMKKIFKDLKQLGMNFQSRH